MPTNHTRDRHADLVERMAEAFGLDLEEKVMEGRLGLDTLDDAVMRCTGCADPEACDRWLTEHADGAAQAPEACRNIAFFDLLKQGKHI